MGRRPTNSDENPAVGGPSACGLTPDPAVLAWRLVPLCDHIRNRATAAGHADRGGRRVSRALADHRRASHTSGGSVQRGRAAGRGVFRSLAGTGGRNRLAGDRNLFRHRLRPALLDRPARRSSVPVVRARSRPPVLRHGARFHNIYGPHGTWFGGREKAPAALSRKVIEALDLGHTTIDIWGDGSQTRSFCFIDDCVLGVDQIMHCDRLIATPINLGSSELISIDDLARMVEAIGGVKLHHTYDLNAPKGVAGRNSDNTFIKSVLDWEPHTPLRAGMEKTYAWIAEQYADRKAGKRVVKD